MNEISPKLKCVTHILWPCILQLKGVKIGWFWYSFMLVFWSVKICLHIFKCHNKCKKKCRKFWKMSTCRCQNMSKMYQGVSSKCHKVSKNVRYVQKCHKECLICQKKSLCVKNVSQECQIWQQCQEVSRDVKNIKRCQQCQKWVKGCQICPKCL